MSKTQITICIPAYNEAANIKNVLTDLLAQQSELTMVKTIYVVCDECTDDTVLIVKKINSKKIKIIEHAKRQGKAFSINEVSRLSQTPILFVIDADVRIPDKFFLDKMARPIIENNVDLTSADIEQLKPEGFFEQVLLVSEDIKRSVFNHYKNGNNFYTCHGLARAFSKRLYKQLNVKFSAGEDLYSYVYCLTKGFKYLFVSHAFITYRLPTNYSDHEKQSIRFVQAIEKINKEFGISNVRELTKTPWLNVIYWTFVYLLRHPILVIVNVIIYIFSLVRSRFINHTQNAWAFVTSSKKAISV